MKIACVVPPLHLAVNELGHGYHPPLGLLMVAGSLIDAGYSVMLLDADAGHCSTDNIIFRLREYGAQIVLVGHSGSNAANPAVISLLRNLRAQLPGIITVHGGVYATFAARALLRQVVALDFIILGEGEITTVALVRALQKADTDFHDIAGLAWRSHGKIIINQPRPLNLNLDQVRAAWELVDWSLYKNHHLPGRSAVVQFSRGCPHTCTYCGQWRYWKEWRHRSVKSFADELQQLRERYDVRTVWMADENWGNDPIVFKALLETVSARQIGIHFFCSMRAEHILRDADHLTLYRQAGIICVMLGVESFDVPTLQRIGKYNHYPVAVRAVPLLRNHGILSVVNIVFGLRNETWRTLWSVWRQLRRMAPDFFNAMHLTPLGWTKEGQSIDRARIVQMDQQKWDFRQPVIQPVHFSPRLFAQAIKLMEALYYVRLGWLWQHLFYRDPIKRQIMQDAIPRMVRVYWREWQELSRASFVRLGQALNCQDQLDILLPVGDAVNEVDRLDEIDERGTHMTG